MRTLSVARRLAVVPAALSLALLFGAGCGSKVAECNKLIEVLNAEGAKLAGKGADAASFKKMADDVDAAAKKIGEVEVKTPELVKYRDDMKKFYSDFAGAARNAGTAMESGDLSKVMGVTKELSELANKNTKLVTDINNFCQGK